MISPEEKILFACTRQEFLEEHEKTVIDLTRDETIRWDMVYSTAVSHGVAPLIYSNLKKCAKLEFKIPKKILNRFKVFCVANSLIKEKKTEKLNNVLSFFNSKNIEVMLVKGAALDLVVYDNPWSTFSGDIDLILKKRIEEQTEEEKKEIPQVVKPRHGIELEFFKHHDIDMNGGLPINFKEMWRESIKINFHGKYVFVMSPEDMLICACINSCRKRFFKLKAICDITEITKRYKHMNWLNVVKKAKKYNCRNILYTALFITKRTLGGEVPEEVFESLEVNRIRKKIIHYLIQRSTTCSLFTNHGVKIFHKKIDFSLLLPYANCNWYQIWKNVTAPIELNRMIRQQKKKQKQELLT